MKSQDMIAKAMEIRARAYNCGVQDFRRTENLVLPAPDNEPFYRMISFGKNTVVSVQPAFMEWCQAWFKDVEGIFCFDAPKLVEIGQALESFGHVIGEIFDCYLPTKSSEVELQEPSQVQVRYLEEEHVQDAFEHEGYHNALTYGDPSATKMVMMILDKIDICGIAGVSLNVSGMMYIGVDVNPAYRRQGLATHMISALTKKALSKGMVTVYPTWYSNIGSRNVALSSGYRPIWVEIDSGPIRMMGAN